MKYRKILLDQLKSQPFFDKQAVRQLSEQYEVKQATLDAYISRSLKSKEIISLKNGLYVSADFHGKNKSDVSYSFYLANILRAPSYISSWTALQYYNLTTDAVHIVTSVTPKVTRAYNTRAGNFSYQSIRKDLFTGFDIVGGGFNFFIASPSKALFDLLYFTTRQFRGIRFENIRGMVEELRVDIDEMSTEEQKNFYKMIKKYLPYE